MRGTKRDPRLRVNAASQMWLFAAAAEHAKARRFRTDRAFSCSRQHKGACKALQRKAEGDGDEQGIRTGADHFMVSFAAQSHAVLSPNARASVTKGCRYSHTPTGARLQNRRGKTCPKGRVYGPQAADKRKCKAVWEECMSVWGLFW